MKPAKTLTFILLVMAILGAIMLVFPKDGITIGEDFDLSFPTFAEMFLPDEEEKVDVSAIVEQQNFSMDSIQIDLLKNDSLIPDTVKADAMALIQNIHKIEFADSNADVLAPFFQILSTMGDQSKVVRIMHYGDSQIEGDRITSFIRKNLQNRFGGSGIGMMPAQQPYEFVFSLKQDNSENFKRYTGFGRKDKNVTHKRYGAMASFSRYAPLRNDTLPFTDTTTYQAWMKFEQSRISYANTKLFKSCKLFYSHNKANVKVKVKIGEEIVKEGELRPTEVLSNFRFQIPENTESFVIEFEGNDSPDIYGVSLDDYKGLAVDNIGLRGSSGTIFGKFDYANLKSFYTQLNVKMFILQFGGNVMPHIQDTAACERYGRWFRSQIKTIRSMVPDACFIVIGPSDMSTKIKDRYVSYEYLETVIKAMRQAAFDEGAGYWDMYSAMGGKNSMPSWVNAEPALAAKDYTHFTPKGAKVVANMFYNAFMLEYNKYIQKLQEQVQ